MNRRGFLRNAAAAIASSPALATQMKLAAHGVAGVGAANVGGLGMAAPVGPNAAPREFRSFLDFWREFGEEQAKSQAKYNNGFDADLLDNRSMSLAVKQIVQRQRIVERLKAEQHKHFLRTMGLEGVFKWFA